MKAKTIWRRLAAIAGAGLLLAGCSTIVPRTAEPPPPPPPPPVETVATPAPTPEPSATALPTDRQRHRVALLVPMSGQNAAVGQSIANATTMALIDAEAENLRITTYDTATGPRNAAARAVSDGNRLILGPLLAENVGAVRAEAQAAGVPLIAFSNDTTVAGPGAFVMGHIPEQSVARSVAWAARDGATRFAGLLPAGEYGRRAEAALVAAAQAAGGEVVARERYSRGNTSVVSAAQRLRQQGGYDTVLLADSAQLATRAAREVRGAEPGVRLIGTELLGGEAAVTRADAMTGLIFSAVSDERFRRFAESYEARFGNQPYRIATLGYDAVLLALNIAQDWRVDQPFPASRLTDEDGFLGVDGAFRFMPSGVIDRAMEVREIRDGRVVVLENAPRRLAP